MAERQSRDECRRLQLLEEGRIQAEGIRGDHPKGDGSGMWKEDRMRAEEIAQRFEVRRRRREDRMGLLGELRRRRVGMLLGGGGGGGDGRQDRAC